MRSSERPDLDDVHRQFKVWRARGHRRRIPEQLWRSAVGLLARYRASTICRRLVLNPSRFKQMRDVLVGSEIERGRGPRDEERNASRAVPLMSLGRRAKGSAGPAFVELAPLGPAVFSKLDSGLSQDGGRMAAECRLVVDSSSGARLTVILACADTSVIDAVCRSVLGRGLVVPGPATS